MAPSRIGIEAMTVFSGRGARPEQEDEALAAREKGIFVVADGFGGPQGAGAARAACEGVRSFLVKEAGDRDATMPFVLRSYFSLAGNVLFNALVHANRKVMRLNRDKGVNERGGASVLAGYIDGDLLALANAGGCAAWLFRDGGAAELVIPRTYARLCDPIAGDGADDARIPLTALGLGEDLEPEIFEYRLRKGDWLLLHTDGVSGALREQVRACVSGGQGSAEAAAQAASRALEAAELDDNAAAILVGF
jgi:PPM family protein phosphatase